MRLDAGKFASVIKLAKGAGRRTSILALDVGKTRTGLAITDPSCSYAMPYRVLYTGPGGRLSGLAQELQTIIEHQDIFGLVIGWPLVGNGQEGDQCQHILDFLENMYQFGALEVEKPIAMWDERASSIMAMDELATNYRDDIAGPSGDKRNTGKARRLRKKEYSMRLKSEATGRSVTHSKGTTGKFMGVSTENIDSLAAMHILQDFLNVNGLAATDDDMTSPW